LGLESLAGQPLAGQPLAWPLPESCCLAGCGRGLDASAQDRDRLAGALGASDPGRIGPPGQGPRTAPVPGQAGQAGRKAGRQSPLFPDRASPASSCALGEPDHWAALLPDSNPERTVPSTRNCETSHRHRGNRETLWQTNRTLRNLTTGLKPAALRPRPSRRRRCRARRFRGHEPPSRATGTQP
jgi:hypothetical protein